MTFISPHLSLKGICQILSTLIPGTIASCQKAGRWPTALQLLFVMDATAVAPNVVSFNSTIGACETGLGCNPWLMSSLIPRFPWRSHHVGNQRIQPSRDDFAPFAGQWKMEQSLRDDLQVSQWCQAVQREDPDQNGWVQKWPKCMGIRVFSPQFSDKQNVGVFRPRPRNYGFVDQQC